MPNGLIGHCPLPIFIFPATLSAQVVEYSRDNKPWRTVGSVRWPVFEEGGNMFVSCPERPVAMESGAKIMFKVCHILCGCDKCVSHGRSDSLLIHDSANSAPRINIVSIKVLTLGV